MSPSEAREHLQRSIQQLTRHPFSQLTTRGDAAIKAALTLIPPNTTLLIPEEGGWLSYHKIPREKKIPFLEVHCSAATIDLADLQDKLTHHSCGAFLYQNPGGYFAEQPMKEIYDLCSRHGCLVIVDASGGIGTSLCDGRYADIIVGSFGEWKLVEAGKGGFISWKSAQHTEKLNLPQLADEEVVTTICKELQTLPQRISFLLQRREKIINDLSAFTILHPADQGFVVVLAYSSEEEKEKIINYCRNNQLEWTECPRYIRVKRPAISIEVKRLQTR